MKGMYGICLQKSPQEANNKIYGNILMKANKTANLCKNRIEEFSNIC